MLTAEQKKLENVLASEESSRSGVVMLRDETQTRIAKKDSEIQRWRALSCRPCGLKAWS